MLYILKGFYNFSSSTYFKNRKIANQIVIAIFVREIAVRIFFCLNHAAQAYKKISSLSSQC